MTESRMVWPLGIDRLIDKARVDVGDLLAGRCVNRALNLSVDTGLEFAVNSFPMYFTGAFESKFVMVHLNPKLSPRLEDVRYHDFDEYIDAHRRFGYHRWEQDPTYRSAFDHKQVRFLRPFGVIDFMHDTEPGHDRVNVARALDQKFQLELIPYATQTFSERDFTSRVLAPHFGRVLGAIAAYERDYVIFCGAVFDRLLSQTELLSSRRDYRFRLPTTRGESVAEYRFSSIQFRYGDSLIRAGIAQSFAKQGLPMSSYGAKCCELYYS